MPTKVGTRDSFMEPSFPSTQRDPLRNYPIGHSRALIDYYKTKDVLQNGSARGVPARNHNDVNFALQRDIAKGQGPIASVRKRPWDLVTMDWVNSRSATATPASGLFVTPSNAAGTFIPVGDHSENTASPTVVHFATDSTHLSGIYVVGLFKVDPLDTDGIVGVLLRGTAATDHIRFEYRTTDGTVHLVTRASSSDTSNANVTPATTITLIPSQANEVYMSLGFRLNADNTFVGVMNGEVIMTGTISAGAQALTGTAVGVRQTGAAPGTGPALFQAVNLKNLG